MGKKLFFAIGLFVTSQMLFASMGRAAVKSIRYATKADLVTVGLRESKTLKVKVRKTASQKNTKLIWKSTKPKVLYVNKRSGKMRGKKVGYATLIVKKVGSKARAKLRIHVVKKVKSVQFVNNLDGSSVKTNTSFQIKAAVLPKAATIRTLRWSSSKKGTATVSRKGLVTTKKKGTTLITAKATDGTGKKVSCKIKVVQPVSSIKITSSDDKKFRVRISETMDLNAVVSPSSASNKKVKWISSNENVASVSSSGLIMGLLPGTTEIKAVAKDGTGVYASKTITVVQMLSTDAEFAAHRGFSSEYPENTMIAFEKAILFGFSAVECDIWETLDGDFAINHNNSLKKMYGVDVNLTEITMEKAKTYKHIKGNGVDQYPNETVPSLEEFFKLLSNYRSRDIKGMVELKMVFSDESLDKILALVDRYGLENQISFSSFCYDQRVNNLTYMRRKNKNIGLQLLTYGPEDSIYDSDQNTADWCKENEIDMSCEYTALDAKSVMAFHEMGRKVRAWTVDEYMPAYELVNKMGVDGIISDYIYFE